MRVVVVPHAYLPSIGGAERYARGVAESLVSLGHEVHVVVADVVNPEAFYELYHAAVDVPEETIAGVQVHRLPFHTFSYRRLGPVVGSRRAIRSALTRFRQNLDSVLSTLQPDVVITLPHLFPNVEDVVGLRSSASWKLVYAPMLHEDDLYWSIERVSEAVVAADGVIALTEHERSRLLASYGARSESTAVVPPGVDLAAHHGPGDREPVVLFIGRRTPSKRLDVLYDAMKLVWIEQPSARLVVAGSAPSRGLDPAAFMAADQRVTVITSPSDTTRDHLLASARLLVNPSMTESFGIATLEAWSHGAPVVVPNMGVNRSLVHDGIDGLLATPDAEGIAEKITVLLERPGLALSMGNRGRDRVIEEFSWSASATALETLAKSL